MRLIDADALKDKCYITVGDTTIGRNNYVMFHEIDDAPTIDAVEVIRCDYCKWSDWYTVKHGHISIPLCYCTRIGKGGYTSNDYCSYGERSEE